MIVMIFLTQNNFLNGPGISDRLLGFYRTRLTVTLTGQQVSSWLDPPGQHMHRPSLHAASDQRFKAVVPATQHQEAATHSPYSAAL